jgi:excisionase family DNA binding protein
LKPLNKYCAVATTDGQTAPKAASRLPGDCPLTIEHMTDFTPRTDGQPDLITVRELAETLRVSTTSVYRLVERRDIPFHRLPRGLRFRREDVDAYLGKCRVESA